MPDERVSSVAFWAGGDDVEAFHRDRDCGHLAPADTVESGGTPPEGLRPCYNCAGGIMPARIRNGGLR
jgi:hypothetical protein